MREDCTYALGYVGEERHFRKTKLLFSADEITLFGFRIEFHRLGLRISGFRLCHTRIPSIRSTGINILCGVLCLSPLGIHPSLPPEGMTDGGWGYYFLSDHWITPLASTYFWSRTSDFGLLVLFPFWMLHSQSMLPTMYNTTSTLYFPTDQSHFPHLSYQPVPQASCASILAESTSRDSRDHQSLPFYLSLRVILTYWTHLSIHIIFIPWISPLNH